MSGRPDELTQAETPVPQRLPLTSVQRPKRLPPLDLSRRCDDHRAVPPPVL